MLCALNINGFRSASASKRFRSYKELQKAIESTRSDTRVYAIRVIAEVDPVKRASAADMLDMLFGDYKKPETTLTCNNIDSLKTRVDEPFRLPMEKRLLHIPKAEKNCIDRKRRQALARRSICNNLPHKFPAHFLWVSGSRTRFFRMYDRKGGYPEDKTVSVPMVCV
jgi:hypothetical protein